MDIDEVTFTKFDAARRQLDTAIQLWFTDADPVSTHTLAHASHEIIYRLFRNSGQTDLSYDVECITDTERKEMAISLKTAPNFFKHANNQSTPNETITLVKSDIIFFMVLSVTGLMRMKIKLRPVEHALMFWALFHFPQWFPDDVQARFAEIKTLKNVRAISKDKFLQMFLRIVKRNQLIAESFGGVE